MIVHIIFVKLNKELQNKYTRSGLLSMQQLRNQDVSHWSDMSTLGLLF